MIWFGLVTPPVKAIVLETVGSSTPVDANNIRSLTFIFMKILSSRSSHGLKGHFSAIFVNTDLIRAELQQEKRRRSILFVSMPVDRTFSAGED